MCNNRVVRCSNPGCGIKVHQSNLKSHQQNECIAAINRKLLLKQSEERLAKQEQEERERREKLAKLAEEAKAVPKLTVKIDLSDEVKDEAPPSTPKVSICPQCGEGVKEIQLAIHMVEKCNFRPIACPNYGVGCNQKAIPLNNMHFHLLNDCAAERFKDEMIQRSKKRKEYIQCATCGYQVELSKFRKHERELCENRLVPCRNHHLGCSVLVPANEREIHEKIAENYERFCLYFSGHGSYIHIQESDILAPWTAEVS